ncbi:ribosome silencing factor [Rheinheimera muenzenbergensis]|uniref:Ribosomal silencing factor RsfS n=1 Tax=Rheinheimera muenzenbergensis TaxID=1193628 RepID=A0ABU8C4A7_9GAMM|nr:ribosome silencing factor [Gammaproteobacteria bacterium]MBU1553671.1 ribosome silencing factor [Gammaproteobacteria bacterium]MBU2071389.1 ribosome silencing factor [Gammaproteobacteria bacterium]MBU2182401.1 ribosome silencing factor [Gammaproteobacteria bacterium]MBU2204139.1 ribosome silencing factor [Gammaproteobacteria bacterium]
MQTTELVSFIQDKIDDLKGRDIVTLDVRGKSSITQFMVICSGTSNRHTKSIADYVAAEVKKAGIETLGIEGQASGEWVLLDLNDVVVHVMLEETRGFYQLEKLWSA